jgi:hypothetical protein
MPESESFAIATQQAHAVGKSPKGYGTSEGRQAAKQKYDTPRDDVKTADPGASSKEKKASIGSVFSLLGAFSDELVKIAGALNGSPTTLGEIATTVPKNPMKDPGKYSKVNSSVTPSPIAMHQPMLDAPPVRR